jgi:hypothetical protein
MSVSITELIGQAIFQTGSEILNVGQLWRHRPLLSQQYMDLVALPMPSTRCPHSVESGMEHLL